MYQLPVQRLLALRQILRDSDASSAFEAASVQSEGTLDIVVNGFIRLSESFERGWESDGSVKKAHSARMDKLHAKWEVSGYLSIRIASSTQTGS